MDQSSRNALPRGPLLILGVSWFLLLGSLLIPAIPLDTSFASAVAFVAESGSRWGFPVVVTLVGLLLVTRKGLSFKRRLVEMLVLAATFAVVFGAGDILNELLIKPIMGKPRPFIAQLDEDGTLGTSMEVFYESLTHSERSEHLKDVLESPIYTGVKLSEPVRNHWIRSVGYSLPSGHTLAAFALLAFGLISTKVMSSTFRYAVACVLIPWAIAVSYSRVLLRVHWPYDILSSGMAGILVGLALYSLVFRLLWMKKPKAEASVASVESE